MTARFMVLVNDLFGLLGVEAYQAVLAVLTGYMAMTKILKETNVAFLCLISIE